MLREGTVRGQSGIFKLPTKIIRNSFMVAVLDRCGRSGISRFEFEVMLAFRVSTKAGWQLVDCDHELRVGNKKL